VTQRHQLIIEEAKKTRVQSMINEPSVLDDLDNVKDVQRERDNEFLKGGKIETQKNFLQQSIDMRNEDIR